MRCRKGQDAVKTRPRRGKDEAKTRPRRDQNTTKTRPRRDQDATKMRLRRDQDAAKMRCGQDTPKTRPRHFMCVTPFFFFFVLLQLFLESLRAASCSQKSNKPVELLGTHTGNPYWEPILGTPTPTPNSQLPGTPGTPGTRTPELQLELGNFRKSFWKKN